MHALCVSPVRLAFEMAVACESNHYDCIVMTHTLSSILIEDWNVNVDNFICGPKKKKKSKQKNSEFDSHWKCHHRIKVYCRSRIMFNETINVVMSVKINQGEYKNEK